MHNLKNGQLLRVPLVDSLLRKVNHPDVDLGAFQGYDGTGGSPDVPCSDAADVRHFDSFQFGHLTTKHQKISSQ